MLSEFTCISMGIQEEFKSIINNKQHCKLPGKCFGWFYFIILSIRFYSILVLFSFFFFFCFMVLLYNRKGRISGCCVTLGTTAGK